MKKLLFRLAAVALSFLLGLCVLEGLSRIWPARNQAYRSTAIDPKAATMKNAFGYRDWEYSEEKPPGTFRITVLGDSFTWGYGVYDVDTYSNRMELALRARKNGTRFEVLNCGKIGWTTQRQLKELKSRVIHLNPDLVLLGYFLNDPEPSNMKQQRENWKPYARRAVPSKGLNGWLFRHTNLYKLTWDRLESTRQRKGYIRYFQGLYSDDYPGWQVCKDSLEGMKRFLDERSVPLVVVNFPIFDPHMGEKYPFRKQHAKVEAHCKALGLPYLDLLDTYRNVDPVRLAVDPFLDPHPNELAHRLASESILLYLIKNRFVPLTQASGGSPMKSAQADAQVVLPQPAGNPERPR